MSRRSLPSHLRTQRFAVPGPGTYLAKDSVQILSRYRKVSLDSTANSSRRGFNNLPKNNPGPGTYSIDNLQALYNSHRCKAMEPGSAFPLGPKDAILANVSKNKNPGPGEHNIKDLNASKPALNATMGGPEKTKPLFDNGVPGAGTYDIDDHKKIPSFKIC